MLTQAVCTACGAVNRITGGHDPLTAKCGRCSAPLQLGEPTDVDDAGLDRALKHTLGPVLVDVWAPWCGPCRKMAPEFAQAAAGLAGKARLLKLNADASSRVRSLGVQGIPALLLFNGGQVIARRAGLTRAEDLVRWTLASVESTVKA